MRDKPASVSDAEKFLAAAVLGYSQACNEEAVARRKKTEALNTLNAAQKQFDDAVAVVRSAARPAESDWGGSLNV